MNIDACYQLGYVIKKHGTSGEVSIFLDVDQPNEYSELESVFVEINQKLVPFFIESIQIRDGKAVVKFEDIDTQDDAQTLKAKSIYLPLSTLPELEKDQFYYHQIVGYNIIDQKLGEIGIIKSVVTTNMQDLLVTEHKDKEVLIPINDSIVLDADHKSKVMHVNMPDGLLDVYLE